MSKKTIDDIHPGGRRILVRLDLNVPQDDTGRITDDRRIRAALPTIQKLLHGGGRLIMMSHLGRPTGDAANDRKYTLAPVAERASALLEQRVHFVGAVTGAEVANQSNTLHDGECCLIENLRFDAAETIKDKDAAKDSAVRGRKDMFAASLAQLGDVYVNDAFGTCHRDNASMLTVPQHMADKPRVIGYLVARELAFLGEAVRAPKRPFIAVLGGAKVSDKIGAIQALLDRCDTVLIGGAMAYTFLAAAGHNIGKSLVERDRVEEVARLREKAGDALRLPVDSVAAVEVRADVETRVSDGDIPDGLMGLDIGPKTIDLYGEVISGAGTIFWNGPMGVFETPPFDAGTRAVAQRVADATDRGAISIIGGGDSAAAAEVAGVADRISHISTGGGASLEFIEGRPFAALEVIDDA